MDQRDLRNRLRSAEGHMGAIAEMIERSAPCVNILHQVRAVRSAMGAINRELWRAYLLDKNCGLRTRNKSRRAKEWQQLHVLLEKERAG
ncbi:MAG: metal-sensitive transcriptional regulator [Chloroflexota bacterium]|nr:metal-sensitive transcriptional regulator [Chloroflexota bacterium]